MLIGIGTVNLKADFETDLHNMLSLVRFSRENHEDPLLWVECYRCYKAYKVLYKKFQNRVSEIVGKYGAFRERKTIAFSKKVNTSNGSVKDVFCFLRFGRDLYRCVSDYMDEAYDLFADLNTIDGIASTECYHAFVCRMFGLMRCCIREFAETVGTEECFHMTDQKPCKKILARLMETFAKGDAYEEFALEKNGKNDSTLVQKNNIFLKTFLEFSRKNKGTLEKAKKTFGTPSAESWFEVLEPGKELDYLDYLTMQPWNFIDALRTLSRDASDCVACMAEIKVPAELKKEALPFFKGEKDVGELSKATEIFRTKEKRKRQDAQNEFAKAKIDRDELEERFYWLLKQRRMEKEELGTLPESGVESSNKKDEVKALEKETRKLKKQIGKLSHLTIKTKHKMERQAAKNGEGEEDECRITKKEHDMAVFANYVQLPGRCDALLDAFLYYQAIMWNVFTDGIDVTKGYGWQIYEALKIKELELTDDFEEEYHTLTKGI